MHLYYTPTGVLIENKLFTKKKYAQIDGFKYFLKIGRGIKLAYGLNNDVGNIIVF